MVSILGKARGAIALGLGALLIFSTSCATRPVEPRPSAIAAKVQPNVIYGQAGKVALTMDIYLPAGAGDKVRPVVMYVHGGGWRMGSKSMVAMMPGPSELLRRGYVVAAINYRLAPEYKFPAMLEDAKCAVRFLRVRAKLFNLDPNRIGVMGDSAGGHLAALLGLTDSSAGFDGQCNWTNASSRVRAVVDLYGPSDFTGGLTNFNKGAISLIKEAFGAQSADDPILKRASPVTYISSAAPPFLILHGNRDKLVSLEQSAELNEKLKAAGVSSTLVVITNYSHGYTPLGLKSSPSPVELSKIVADFFDKNMRRPKPVNRTPGFLRVYLHRQKPHHRRDDHSRTQSRGHPRGGRGAEPRLLSQRAAAGNAAAPGVRFSGRVVPAGLEPGIASHRAAPRGGSPGQHQQSFRAAGG